MECDVTFTHSLHKVYALLRDYTRYTLYSGNHDRHTIFFFKSTALQSLSLSSQPADQPGNSGHPPNPQSMMFLFSIRKKNLHKKNSKNEEMKKTKQKNTKEKSRGSNSKNIERAF